MQTYCFRTQLNQNDHHYKVPSHTQAVRIDIGQYQQQTFVVMIASMVDEALYKLRQFQCSTIDDVIHLFQPSFLMYPIRNLC